MKKKLFTMHKKILAVILVTLMLLTNLGVAFVSAEPVELENIAIGKTATANGHEAESVKPSFTIDNNEKTWWGSSTGVNQKWLKIDLQNSYEIHEMEILWERRNVLDYSLEYSIDDVTWTTLTKRDQKPVEFLEKFDTGKFTARYVKVTINNFESNSEGVDWPTAGIKEFRIFAPKGSEPEVPMDANVALNKPASASDIEVAQFSAGKAFDGIVNRDGAKDSRWASNTTTSVKWLKVDLGREFSLKTFKIIWERRNAKDFEIQVSKNNIDWETVLHITEKPTTFLSRYVLETEAAGQYVRLKINSYDPASEGVTWNSVSVYEFEIYQEDIPLTEEEILQSIKMPVQPKDADNLVLPVLEGFDVSLSGVDYNYVVDKDGTIYPPLVDTEVEVSLNIKGESIDSQSSDILVTIPGKYNVDDSINEKPQVIPELREWFGKDGNLNLSSDTRIVLDSSISEKDQIVADELIADYEDIFDIKLTKVIGETPKAGDIIFKLDSTKWFGKEGYNIDIDDYITISSNHYTGLYWATRTILQIAKTCDNVFPKGLIRDYPRWEVRGLMLDVGRKSFGFDFLKQLAKEMSWYKLNDFQVHLNDNYIFLENYSNTGLNPFDADSGFRLESDMEGLTNTDVYYSKDQFRSFIKDSRNIGLNIIPEFDVPAHSLAFTKIRPDLASGTVGRQADHLDVTNPNTLPFVKDVFNEYLTGEDPVFDEDTVIHVGTDEYDAKYTEQFRKFTDDMLGFIQEDHNRTVRLWGSLSARPGNTPVRSEGVQMNIWNAGWANPGAMHKQGFDMINMIDGTLYIVPDAGYYYDYLNIQNLYNNWTANNMSGTVVSSGSDQMLGGAYALWNDQIDISNNGISEVDAYIRLAHAMPTMAEKLWGKGEDKTFAELQTLTQKVGKAPRTNLLHEVESKSDDVVIYDFEKEQKADLSLNNYNLIKEDNVGFTEDSLVLKGGTSYVESDLTDVSLGHTLQLKVKLTGDINAEISEGKKSEMVLFEQGTTQIKASQNGSGKLGFSREGLDYTFDYQLPKDEFVDLAIATQQGKIKLYVNGVLEDEIYRVRTSGNFYSSMNASLLIPIGRIGSKTDSFVGEISFVRVTKNENIDFIYVTKYSLNKLSEDIAKLDLSKYTSASVSVLNEADAKARLVLENPSATQIEIDDAQALLQKSFDDLELVSLGDLDISLLDFMIKHADKLTEDGALAGVVESVVKKFNEALTEAKVVLAKAESTPESVTQEEIDTATNNLIDTIHLLEFKGNKARLRNLVAFATPYEANKETYRPATYDVFEKAIKDARDVLADESALQDELDDTWQALADALADLRKIPNKDLLRKAIAKGNAINSALYTAESYAVLGTRLAEGDKVMKTDDDTIIKEDVETATKGINKAIEGLVLIPVADTTTTPSSTPTTKADDTTTAATTKANTKSAPKTGEANIALIVTLVATLSLAVAVGIKKSKKIKK